MTQRSRGWSSALVSAGRYALAIGKGGVGVLNAPKPPAVCHVSSSILVPQYDKTTEAMKRFPILSMFSFRFFCYALNCDWSRYQNRPLDQSQISTHQNKRKKNIDKLKIFS
jgi:hypothetical protein